MASPARSAGVGVGAEAVAVAVARVVKAADLRPRAALRPSMRDGFRPARSLASKLALRGRKQATTRMRARWLVLRTRIPARW
jgi:hypothetical protein